MGVGFHFDRALLNVRFTQPQKGNILLARVAALRGLHEKQRAACPIVGLPGVLKLFGSVDPLIIPTQIKHDYHLFP